MRVHGRVADGGGKELDGPGVYAEEEDAVVHAVPVFCEEHVGGREMGRGEEGF